MLSRYAFKFEEKGNTEYEKTVFGYGANTASQVDAQIAPLYLTTLGCISPNLIQYGAGWQNIIWSSTRHASYYAYGFFLREKVLYPTTYHEVNQGFSLRYFSS